MAGGRLTHLEQGGKKGFNDLKKTMALWLLLASSPEHQGTLTQGKNVSVELIQLWLLVALCQLGDSRSIQVNGGCKSQLLWAQYYARPGIGTFSVKIQMVNILGLCTPCSLCYNYLTVLLWCRSHHRTGLCSSKTIKTGSDLASESHSLLIFGLDP